MADDIAVKTWVGLPISATIDEKQARADEIAQLFASFVRAAHSTLNIAIYDFRLDPSQAEIVLGALGAAVDRGVSVRVAYFDQKPEKQRTTAQQFTEAGADPAPPVDDRFINALSARKVQVRAVTEAGIAQLAAAIDKKPISGGGHLMHSKYMIRDGLNPDASLWMGSANFTSDAWSYQDNNVVIISSQDLCGFYATDFAELWSSARIAGSGKNDRGNVTVDGDAITVDFSPGDGAKIEQAIAELIKGAQATISIASMVISSGAIMSELIAAQARGVTIRGVIDGPEMANVIGDFNRAIAKGGGEKSQAKLDQWKQLQPLFHAKQSEPYSAKTIHNFMHNKAIVVDRSTLLTGSFNFSSNATHNAENVLTIADASIASAFDDYIDTLIATY
jgi:phosphatidylserine/phosphatidylglycerophosphate/cardiolipin synthase-like enzyme